MATKRTHRPTAIPVQPDTWGQRAQAPGEYFADLDGIAPNMHWVIKRRATGEIIDTAKGAHKSEVEARVVVLNRGQPTRAENQSWGRVKKEGPRAARGTVWANVSGLSPTQWVERLYTDAKTSDVLREHAARKQSLTLEALENLLHIVDEADRFFPEELLEAISMQLFRKFGIKRAEEAERR